jgi:nucleoside-diphosphate-sugar epimerase
MPESIAERMADFLTAEAAVTAAASDLGRLAGKNLLITGACGLIGVWFVAGLAGLGDKAPQVTAVTRRRPPAFAATLLRRLGAQTLCGDLAEAAFRESLPRADYILHAAGYGQPGRFLADPAATIAINVCATLDLAKRLSGDGRMLFISSSEVYSGSPAGPKAEDEIGHTNTDHPRACYIEGKRAGEAVIHAMRSKGLEASAARLALAFGPGVRLDDARVLNSFIAQGLGGELTPLDQGLAVRTYCYAADAVEIMWRILLDGRQAVYNVGGTARTTIGDLARSIAGLMGVPVAFPRLESSLAGAPGEVSLDLSRIHQEFGKTEFVPLAEGLKKTIDWMRLAQAAKESDS